MAESRGITTVEESSDEDAKAEENNRLGPIYDAALRGVMEAQACVGAIRPIHEEGGSRAEDSPDFASVLATIALDRRIVKKIIEGYGLPGPSG